MNCPCRSGEKIESCCGRFITHRAVPEHAQQLMRSRFTAYVLGDADYLRDTWHPQHRPAGFQLDKSITWLGLDIISTATLDASAEVEFEATLLVDGRVDAMHEKSQFVRDNGRWLYTTGTLLSARFAPWKPGRNETCPCGSGKKFKRCCGVAKT